MAHSEERAEHFFQRIIGKGKLHIAMIAHDNQKNNMIQLAKEFQSQLSSEKCVVVGTGTTGTRIEEATGIAVGKMLSGPLGGDAQISSRVVEGIVDVVIFLVDPLFGHPHEPDIQGLLRVCNLKDIPLATNLTSARLILQHIFQNISEPLGLKR